MGETGRPPEADLLLPGHELVEIGLRDLAAGLETAPALLVASFSTRLRGLGVPVPPHSISGPELRLYLLLAGTRADAHHHYNGLVQRLVSYAQAAECTRY